MEEITTSAKPKKLEMWVKLLIALVGLIVVSLELVHIILLLSGVPTPAPQQGWSLAAIAYIRHTCR